MIDLQHYIFMSGDGGRDHEDEEEENEEGVDKDIKWHNCHHSFWLFFLHI